MKTWLLIWSFTSACAPFTGTASLPVGLNFDVAADCEAVAEKVHTLAGVDATCIEVPANVVVTMTAARRDELKGNDEEAAQ